MNDDGHIAIVHLPPLSEHPDPKRIEQIDLRIHPDNTNYFKVKWVGNNYPQSSNSCASGACQSVYRGCLCDVNINESSVFTSVPTETDIIENLFIGSFHPDQLGSYTKVSGAGSVNVWHKHDGYDKDTVFSINYRGKETFLQNKLSTVEIAGATMLGFRNPPGFLNIGFREKRDAIYETDAVLETYFYNDNVGPFLATRLIQRFGISNPSPRFVKSVAKGM